jgi:Zn ribbon nucleic-acid-binding protein
MDIANLHSLIRPVESPPSPPYRRISSTSTGAGQADRNSYLDKGTTSRQKTGKLGTQRRKLKKSERLEIKRKSRNRIVQHLRRLGENEMADNMTLCGERVIILTCGDHIAGIAQCHRCNIRFCPMCAGRRSSAAVNQYLPYALEFMRQNPHSTPCLLTLTQKKIKGEVASKARGRLMDSFKNFIRHKFICEYFDGGIWACENAISDTGNHLHLHIVIFRKKFIDHKLLKKQWAKVSPGAMNLNIKKIDSIEEGLRECLKYISKPLPADKLELSHVREILSLKGKQMKNTFGKFREFIRNTELPETEQEFVSERLEAGSCCPMCQSQDKRLYELSMSVRELVEFHRQVESRLSFRSRPPERYATLN